MNPAPDSAPRLPGWTPLRVIGRGSYGEVWLARDDAGTCRALKIVRRDRFDHDRPYQRELSGIRRFEPVSRGHDSQVAIFSVAEDAGAGCFTYLMELADDASGRQPPDPATYEPRTLQGERSRRGALPHEECIAIGLALATAVQHLHDNGLVHRDIKPSNVIFVNGVPKLADIGLVTSVDATLSFVGTEGFLPPEGPGSPQADLYSLGKVLYEIRTGQDRLEFPALPTLTGGPNADRDQSLLEFNQLLLKACQNDPRRRYRSAGELLDDLRTLAAGGSLRRQRARQRLARRARAAALLAASAALATLGLLRWQHEQSLHEAQAERDRESLTRRQAAQLAATERRQLASSHFARGEEAARDGDSTGAAVWFAGAVALDPALTNAPRTHRLTGHLALPANRVPTITHAAIAPSPVSAFAPVGPHQQFLALTPNGEVHRLIASALSDRSRPSRHPGPVLARTQPFREIVPDPAGERAALIAEDGAITLLSGLDEPGSPSVLPLRSTGSHRLARFSPSGRQFVTLHDERHVILLEAGARRERFRLPHSSPVTALGFSPDGSRLAVATADGRARLWDTESGSASTPVLPTAGPASRLLFSPAGRRLLSLSPGGIRLFDSRSGDPISAQPAPDPAPTEAAFSPDGRFLATVGDNGIVRIWDAVQSESIIALPTDGPPRQNGLAFSPDGRFLMVIGPVLARIWGVPTPSPKPARWSPAFSALPVAPARPSESLLPIARFGADAASLAILGPDGIIRVHALDLAGERPGENPSPLAGSNDAIEWFAARRMGDGGRLEAIPHAESLTRWNRWPSPAAGSPGASTAPAASPVAASPATLARALGADGQWFAAAFHWTRVLREPSTPASSNALAEAQAGLDRARQHLAALEAATARPLAPAAGPDYPPRPAEATDAQLDLTSCFNARLDRPWLPGPAGAGGNDLASLPPGLHQFQGTTFDVRGIVQLSGRQMEQLGGRFPDQVHSPPLNRAARRLHFLHGTPWPSLAGTTIGRYRVHYSDGSTRDIPVVFGRDVREWWSPPSQPPLTTGAAIAWEGTNPASTAAGFKLRLFHMVWRNPQPDAPIARIEFSSTLETSALFVVGVTTEP